VPTTQQWAQALYTARRDRRPIDPLSEVDAALTADDAYAIQRHLTSMIIADGGELRGYKLGLTSWAMQESLGVNEPDFGPLLSSAMAGNGATIDIDQLIAPRIEAEIALRLGSPLTGPGVTRHHAAAAIDTAEAVLEVVDSRIRDWRIRLVDTVADLASTAMVVTGTQAVPLDDFEPRLCGMAIYRNGELAATGAGAAALGDPVAAVAWLANRLAPFGTTLEPGHLILTGALHAAFPIGPDDDIRADFDHLGSVQATCTGTRA
jgi:2-keto-4-pentenoate hydratase